MTDQPTDSFRESDPGATPIREMNLAIEGSPLEPILDEFREELRVAGIVRVRPRFYLSTEWGVPEGTVAIAIPFYLARPDLIRIQAERAGFVEGSGRADILRYLRHEMGHVVNYAYRLFDAAEWTALFGPITDPYPDEYRPEPFSRKHVRHLPGWYAQKHPDEDWAETFAVWMTPGRDWRSEYAGWPEALGKLEYCARVMDEATNRDPVVFADDLDEDVGDLLYTIDDFYRDLAPTYGDGPIPDLDAVLRSMFEDLGRPEVEPAEAPRRAASELLRRIEGDLTADVFRWTGCFPERIRPLLRHLADRSDWLGQVYPEGRETAAVVAITTLVTTLALNHVARGSFVG